MFNVRTGLLASTMLACATLCAPASASPILFAFDVTESPGEYTVQNNSAIFYIYSFIVTNSAGTADANRPNWDWDIFTSAGGCDRGYFPGESGYCYFDLGGAANPIAPGESQTFFFTSAIESEFVIEFATLGDELSFCRGVTNVPSCGIDVTAAPEPGTLSLIGGALGLLGALWRRRSAKLAA